MLTCCCAAPNTASEEVTITKTAPFTQDETDSGVINTMREDPGFEPEAEKLDGAFKEDLKGVMEKVEEEPAKEPELVRVASGAETPFEFVVKARKENGKLGFAVETLFADYCVTRRVESFSPLKTVKPFDRVRKVNGVSGTASELANMIKDQTELELTFQRPVVKEITLEKSGKKAGFQVDTKLLSAGLIIKGLEAGAAMEMPTGTFKPMDRIMAVDGIEGEAGELLKMLKKDRMVLTVCSYY